MRPVTGPILSARTLPILGLALLAGCAAGDRRAEYESASGAPGAEPVAAVSPAEDVPPTPEGAALPVEADLPVAEREQARRDAELAAREAALAERESELRAAERRARAAEASRREAAAPAPPPPTPPAEVAETSQLPEPMPLPEPLPEPEPVRTIALTVPEGTVLEVEFLDSVGSASSTVGDRFEARVVRDVAVDGRTAIPEGSRVLGSVTGVQPLRAVGGKAQLALAFDRLELAGDGERLTIRAGFAAEGASETRRDAATIGGAAAGGAVLGRVLAGRSDRKKGTVIGAIAGAAVGTAIASRTEGEEVEIPAGTVLDLRLEEWVRILVQE